MVAVKHCLAHGALSVLTSDDRRREERWTRRRLAVGTCQSHQIKADRRRGEATTGKRQHGPEESGAERGAVVERTETGAYQAASSQLVHRTSRLRCAGE